MKNFFEFITEGRKPSIRIKYVEIDRSTYETSSSGVNFSVEINGIKAHGHWQIHDLRGMINSLKGDDGTYITRIFESKVITSATLTAFLSYAERQPKNLHFTGRTIDISPLKKTFIEKVKYALENPDEDRYLSSEFLKYFKLEENVNSKRGKVTGKKTGIL